MIILVGERGGSGLREGSKISVSFDTKEGRSESNSHRDGSDSYRIIIMTPIPGSPLHSVSAMKMKQERHQQRMERSRKKKEKKESGTQMTKWKSLWLTGKRICLRLFSRQQMHPTCLSADILPVRQTVKQILNKYTLKGSSSSWSAGSDWYIETKRIWISLWLVPNVLILVWFVILLWCGHRHIEISSGSCWLHSGVSWKMMEPNDSLSLATHHHESIFYTLDSSSVCSSFSLNPTCIIFIVDPFLFPTICEECWPRRCQQKEKRKAKRVTY